jgi:phosphatidate cytidylyltransferase
VLRARLATAAVAIPLLLLLILYAPPLLFAVVVMVIGIGGLAEYAVMAFPTRLGERILTIVLGSTVVIGGAAHSIPQLLTAAVALTVAALLVWILFARPDFEQGLRDVGIALVGIFYVGFFMPHFIWLHTADSRSGPLWVIFVLLIGMAGDSGGYAVGHAFGRHKLMPRVSPGKTVEGAVGIIVISVAAGAAAKLIFLTGVTWTRVLVLSVIMAILGQLGDLTESVMKRTFEVKESGWFFPGHGGVLDRLDSLLFPVAFLYYHISLIH